MAEILAHGALLARPSRLSVSGLLAGIRSSSCRHLFSFIPFRFLCGVVPHVRTVSCALTPVPVKQHCALHYAARPACPASTAACITFVPPNAKSEFVRRKKAGRTGITVSPEESTALPRLSDFAYTVVGGIEWHENAAMAWPDAHRRLDLGRAQHEASGLACQVHAAERSASTKPVHHVSQIGRHGDLFSSELARTASFDGLLPPGRAVPSPSSRVPGSLRFRSATIVSVRPGDEPYHLFRRQACRVTIQVRSFTRSLSVQAVTPAGFLLAAGFRFDVFLFRLQPDPLRLSTRGPVGP